MVQQTDFDSPIPNQQLAIYKAAFILWLKVIIGLSSIELLRKTLQQQGIGSKRAGWLWFMTPNTELTTN